MLLSIFYRNIRGFRTKAKKNYSNILNNNSVFNDELFDTKYEVFRTDRGYQLFNLSMEGGSGTYFHYDTS